MRSILLVAAIFCSGCVRTPDWYPAPEQYVPISGPEPVSYGDYFVASIDGSDNYVVSGIHERDRASWRWTRERAELRFHLTSVEGRVLRVQFVLHGKTFKLTGPVTVVFRVNGNELARECYEEPERKQFEKAVQPDWLFPNAENRLVIEVLNPWQAEPGVQLGLLLEEAGLVVR
jgi:hypothetical protein